MSQIVVFKNRVPNSTFIMPDGTALVFAPCPANPSIGAVVTSDPKEIAELSAALAKQGKQGGILFQDNEPVDLPKMVEAHPISDEEQKQKIAQEKKDIEARKIEAQKVLSQQPGTPNIPVNSSTIAGATKPSSLM